jgi:hypothetical protein
MMFAVIIMADRTTKEIIGKIYVQQRTLMAFLLKEYEEKNKIGAVPEILTPSPVLHEADSPLVKPTAGNKGAAALASYREKKKLEKEAKAAASGT